MYDDDMIIRDQELEILTVNDSHWKLESQFLSVFAKKMLNFIVNMRCWSCWSVDSFQSCFAHERDSSYQRRRRKVAFLPRRREEEVLINKQVVFCL